ncbi:hypothetical protein XA68_12087 [Ophiocordyceps unilateralis]|uniref:Uncharacterized protein n=1 Tax=Ophiocordyceps unilateralis TaxID=268505 RepID=A0A2A9PDN9_OPHUN|nr:hypothetical protein XA68_12087 [Ophiocordyceps unilateralis]
MAPETPKAASSRLLTMKFMQRSVASASESASQEGKTSSKKRKHGYSSEQGRADSKIDEALIQTALENQEAARQAALAKHTAADSHWKLEDKWNVVKGQGSTTKQLNVVYVGYGDIDSSLESGDTEEAPAKGRTSTRQDKKVGGQLDEPQNDQTDDESDNSSLDGSETRRKRKDRHDSDASSSQDRSRTSETGTKACRGGRANAAKPLGRCYYRSPYVGPSTTKDASAGTKARPGRFIRREMVGPVTSVRTCDSYPCLFPQCSRRSLKKVCAKWRLRLGCGKHPMTGCKRDYVSHPGVVAVDPWARGRCD